MYSYNIYVLFSVKQYLGKLKTALFVSLPVYHMLISFSIHVIQHGVSQVIIILYSSDTVALIDWEFCNPYPEIIEVIALVCVDFQFTGTAVHISSISITEQKLHYR